MLVDVLVKEDAIKKFPKKRRSSVGVEHCSTQHFIKQPLTQIYRIQTMNLRQLMFWAIAEIWAE